MSRDHLEEEDAQGPYVDFEVIALILDHLRRHVLVGATQCPPLAHCSSEAEVAQLD